MPLTRCTLHLLGQTEAVLATPFRLVLLTLQAGAREGQALLRPDD